jgi:putative (di)nucleoside polyphosphate hydrolase
VLAEHPDWLRYEIPRKWRPKAWENRYCGQEQKWFLLRFDGSDDELTVETDEPEFRQWKWATVDEVIAGAIEFKRDLYPAVFVAFGDWL